MPTDWWRDQGGSPEDSASEDSKTRRDLFFSGCITADAWTNTLEWPQVLLQHMCCWVGCLFLLPLSFAKEWVISCAPPSSSPHRCTIEFRSALWLGHCKTLIFFCWRHVSVDVDGHSGSSLFISSFLTESQNWCYFFKMCIFDLKKGPGSSWSKTAPKYNAAPLCFSAGLVFFGWYACCFCT